MLVALGTGEFILFDERGNLVELENLFYSTSALVELENLFYSTSVVIFAVNDGGFEPSPLLLSFCKTAVRAPGAVRANRLRYT